jgi:uncharacterized repeat protein (TIGR01451 family)
MKKVAWFVKVLALWVIALGPRAADAAPALRVQLSQHGDMTWIGNTLAQECAGTARPPVVGTIPNCGNSTNDSAPDVFWSSDNPAPGQARARTQNMASDARSTAVLNLPVGATVTYARLYWGAQLATNTPDTAVTLNRPGTFTANVTADASFSLLKAGTTNVFWYEATADVTALVRTNAAGAYRLTGVDSVNLVNFNSNDPFEGWSLVVFYELATEPLRNLALFDGLDFVADGTPASITISGFQVPNAGFDAKLGVWAFEGDIVFTGDSLIFNGTALADGVNPANNFFNGSRSFVGAPVSVAGDLPQMDGLAGSMSGIDLDIVDITGYLKAGDTSATVQATSSGDTYMIGAFATSIATYQPEFATSVKSFVDLNGGSVLVGDILEYTVVATNTGNDAAVKTVLTDPLPAGMTYVPGSIRVTAGANPGAKTDASGDDQAEYVAANRSIVVRIGTGADSTQGGTVGIGESTTIQFRVQIDAGATGTLSNQATISAGGLKGNPTTSYPSGNGTTPGTPTTTPVDQCDATNPCPAARPICVMTAHPYVCGQCIVDTACGAVDSGRVCDVSLSCVDGCRGSGGNRCPAGQTCTSGSNQIGTCLVPGFDGGGDARPDANDGATVGDGASDASGDGGAAGAGGASGASGAGGASGNAGASGSAGAGGNAGSGGAAGASGSAGAAGNAGAGGAGGAAGATGTDGSAGHDAASDADAASTDATMRDALVSDAAGDSIAEDADDGATDGPEEDATADAGTESDAAADGRATDARAAFDDGSIEGGGCACTTPRSRASAPWAGASLLLALSAVRARRRRAPRCPKRD